MLSKNFNASMFFTVSLSFMSCITYAAPVNNLYLNKSQSDLKFAASLALLNKLGEKKTDQQIYIPLNYKIEASYDEIEKKLNEYNQSSNISELNYLILRSVMRNPSTSSLAFLHELHRGLSNFIPQDELTLNWILGGLKSAKKIDNYNDYPESQQSKFIARVGWMSTNDLRKFLLDDPVTMLPSKLIVGLEALTASLAYRSISAKWVESPNPPMEPMPSNGVERAQFFDLLKITTEQWRVPSIISLYYDRDNERLAFDLDTSSMPENSFVADYNSELSDVSDDEDSSPPKSSQQRLPKPTFHNQLNINGDSLVTWPYSAHSAGLAVRANVSGTAPLALSVLVGIASKYKSPIFDPLVWKLNQFDSFKEAVERNGAILFVPNYERSDYHTIVETFAGIKYYAYKLNELRSFPNVSYPVKNALSHPIDLYKEAVENLAEGASSNIYTITLTGYPTQLISLNESIKTVMNEFIIPKLESKRIEFQTSGNLTYSNKT